MNPIIIKMIELNRFDSFASIYYFRNLLFNSILISDNNICIDLEMANLIRLDMR